MKFEKWRYITGGWDIALEQILFVLPKTGSKLELFLMQPLRVKFGKILSVDRKDQRRHSVWVGKADFSEITQRKQKLDQYQYLGNCAPTPPLIQQ